MGDRVWLVLDGDDYEPRTIVGVYASIEAAENAARERMDFAPRDFYGRPWAEAKCYGDAVRSWRIGSSTIDIEEHPVVHD